MVCGIKFLPFTGSLSRKLSSASSLGSMEESHFLQASLDSSDSLSERRNAGEASISSYYIKSMTPGAFEAALRQKEGELSSYMSRLVCFLFSQSDIYNYYSGYACTIYIVFLVSLRIQDSLLTIIYFRRQWKLFGIPLLRSWSK